MLITRITRGIPERVFLTLYNDSGSALSKGQVCCYSMDGTRDGYEVTDPSSTNAMLVAGLAHAATADGNYGLVQAYGLDDDALVARVGSASNDPIAVGDVYDIYSASSMLSYIKAGCAVIASASDGAPAMFVAAASVASGGASSLSSTTAKVFIRCL